MANYRGWDTATSLLLAYEASARAHNAAIQQAPIEPGQTEPHEYFGYMHGFALLILNASIIEGTMRTILTERVTADLDRAIQRNNAAGLTAHTAPDRLLGDFCETLKALVRCKSLPKPALLISALRWIPTFLRRFERVSRSCLPYAMCWLMERL